MAQRSRRPNAQDGIREAVRQIASSVHLHPVSAPLPVAEGTQLSLTGQTTAWGNGGDFDPETLAEALRRTPALSRASEGAISLYARRRRFLLFAGDLDRFTAAASAIGELLRQGCLKFVVAADTPAERDSLARFLTLSRGAFAGAGVSAYLPGDDSRAARYRASAIVSAFCASPSPEILVLSRDSFNRGANLLRRPRGGDPAETLCSVIAQAKPVLIVSARRVLSARTVARSAEVFGPCLSFLIAGETKRVRDAVIWRPSARDAKTAKAAEPEQLRF